MSGDDGLWFCLVPDVLYEHALYSVEMCIFV